jgi:hypothetical protein
VKFQNVYNTNIDYEKSYEELCRNFPGVDIMPKGSIRFKLLPYDIIVLISPKGKIQVAWNNPKEKEYGLELLKSRLVPIAGEKEVVFDPCHQNILKILYPGPDSINLFWCKKKFSYVRKRLVDIFVLISFVLLFTLFVIFDVARIDPSLRVLNDTVLNPVFSSPISPFYPFILFILFCLYFSNRIKRE